MKFNQQWQARAIRPEGPSQWFPAEVPGNIQYDYGKMMGWGDINYADNVEKFRATEGYTWEYRTYLNYTAKPGECAWFVCEGVDYIFDILIDGNVVLSHEGMFSPVETPLSGHEGAELIVRVHPHPKDPLAKYDDRDQAAQSCKPAVCYGWDWHPRMLVSGIWQDAYVEVRSADHIRRIEPFYTLNEDLTRADIRFEADCDAPVEISLFDPDGNPAGTGDRIAVHNPRLWWCNGQGKPELYTYIARTEGHTVTGTIGLRTVRLVMNEGAWAEPDTFPKGRSAAPIQLELNGRRIFAKGSNWVNPGIYNGRVDRACYEEYLTLVKAANMNILRCWGGAGMYKKDFYDLCDRLGVMVWAEFPLACNNYRGTPEYLRVLEQEATAILLALRGHPSVVMYCGGNELFNNWSGMTDQSLALRLLNKLCYDLDRDRPFLMTSPVYGMGHGGYTFYDPDQKCDVFTLFQRSRCTAYTEFGCPGLTDADALRKVIPEEDFWPAKPGGVWELHHGYNAWGEQRWLCRDVMDMYSQKPITCIEDMITLSNWMQCEGYKAIFEEARRQAPYCSMAINWCFNEPWVTVGTNNLLSWPARPRPAYYAVQNALRPVLASARIPKFDWKAGERFTAELWLLNDSPEPAQRVISASIRMNGVEYPLFTWDSGEVPAGENRIGPTVNWILPDVDTEEFTLRLTAGNGASSTYRLMYRKSRQFAVTRQLNV